MIPISFWFMIGGLGVATALLAISAVYLLKSFTKEFQVGYTETRKIKQEL